MTARSTGRLVCGWLLFASSVWAQDSPISAKVRMPLAPVSAGGKTILAYEVELANLSQEDISLLRFQAFADAESKPALDYGQDELARNAKQPAAPVSKDVRLLKPGTRAVIFCWIEFPAAIPQSLQHQIAYTAASLHGQSQTFRDSATAVEKMPNLVLGAPLAPGDWWAAVGPSNASDHRRAQVRVDGNAAAPFAQRFAIDWIELCGGRMFTGKGSGNADFCGYGKDVLAVADAEVVEVKDGVPENKPGEDSRAVKMTLETLLGNRVVLDLGNRLYAVYAHLQPGSIAVKPGDKVRRGQPIGRLGNSGNSDAPHLHFHVALADAVDQVTSVQSQPFPFAFDRFDFLGQYAGRGLFSPSAPQPRSHEIALDGAVVRF